MIYIKLDTDNALLITVSGAIYRGDNLNQKVIFLIPAEVGEIDVLSATVYLTYIRADGVPDIVALERDEEMYNSEYYQFRFPVKNKLTKCSGEVCMWLQIVSGTPSNMVIAKSGECVLQIQDSKNLDDYVCDHQLTAIYELQQTVSELTADGDADSDGSGTDDDDDSSFIDFDEEDEDDGSEFIDF